MIIIPKIKSSSLPPIFPFLHFSSLPLFLSSLPLFFLCSLLLLSSSASSSCPPFLPPFFFLPFSTYSIVSSLDFHLTPPRSSLLSFHLSLFLFLFRIHFPFLLFSSVFSLLLFSREKMIEDNRDKRR